MVFILIFMQVDSQSEKSPSGRSTIFKIKRPSPNSQSDSPKSGLMTQAIESQMSPKTVS